MKLELNEQILQELLAKSKKIEQELLDQCEQAKQLYLKYESTIINKDTD